MGPAPFARKRARGPCPVRAETARGRAHLGAPCATTSGRIDPEPLTVRPRAWQYARKRKLTEGDIIGIDCGAIVDGYYGDHAITFAVGAIREEAQHLVDTTSDALSAGIAQAKIGNYLSDISHAIQVFAEQRCYSVVKVFVGHGIGTALHEEPQVPNFGPPRRGPRLRAGMVLALEPMVNVGTADVRILQDNWTVVTADGRLSAHFEHTITVAEYGGIILSQL